MSLEAPRRTKKYTRKFNIIEKLCFINSTIITISIGYGTWKFNQSSPMILINSQLDPNHSFDPYFYKIHPNTILPYYLVLPNGLLPMDFPTKIFKMFLL